MVARERKCSVCILLDEKCSVTEMVWETLRYTVAYILYEIQLNAFTPRSRFSPTLHRNERVQNRFSRFVPRNKLAERRITPTIRYFPSRCCSIFLFSLNDEMINQPVIKRRGACFLAFCRIEIIRKPRIISSGNHRDWLSRPLTCLRSKVAIV